MDCVWSVQSLSSEIKKSLAAVSCKRVRGIVGRVTRSQSGHAYFEVIDECGDARIGCAVWASKASTTVPEPGLCELGISRIDFYAPQGRCQLIVSDTTPIGGVPTQKALVLAKLHQEGLVDRCRLALPYPVQHLCIVTSSGSAAASAMALAARRAVATPRLSRARWLPGQIACCFAGVPQRRRSGRGLKKEFLRALLVQQAHSFDLLARALGIEALARDA